MKEWEQLVLSMERAEAQVKVNGLRLALAEMKVSGLRMRVARLRGAENGREP